MAASDGADAWRDRVERARIDVRTLFGGRRYRRFVIVAIARTGTTALISLLNAHSRAMCFGEIFRRPEEIGWDIRPYAGLHDARLLDLYKRDPAAFLRQAVWRRWPREIAAVGFKIFYYHARTPPFAAVWDILEQDREIAVLHVKRRNILSQYLSLQLAHRTNVWAVTAPSARPADPVTLDPAACERHFVEVRAMEDEADERFARHDSLSIDYEDLAADKTALMERVTTFLGLRMEALSTPLVRQRTRPLSEAIANFDELKAAFDRTQWAGFFTDARG
jgi:LPS sulfotransferase NodH